MLIAQATSSRPETIRRPHASDWLTAICSAAPIAMSQTKDAHVGGRFRPQADANRRALPPDRRVGGRRHRLEQERAHARVEREQLAKPAISAAGKSCSGRKLFL